MKREKENMEERVRVIGKVEERESGVDIEVDVVSGRGRNKRNGY